MRIISKFHDYYDIGLSFGVDPNIIFKRKPKVIKVEHLIREKTENTKHFDLAKKVFPIFDDFSFRINTVWTSEEEYLLIDNYGCICFCGKIYPFIECGIKLKNKKPKYKYIYSIEKLDELIDNSGSKTIINNYYNTNNKYFSFSRKKIDRFFNHSEKMSYDKLIDMHLYYDSPIFMYEKGTEFKVIINPKLDKREFYQVLDSYTAFQNLSMFMSGILGVKENETINVSDKDLKYMKGFDEKSFRKEPTKKSR